jgi:hypothetical protein
MDVHEQKPEIIDIWYFLELLRYYFLEEHLFNKIKAFKRFHKEIVELTIKFEFEITKSILKDMLDEINSMLSAIRLSDTKSKDKLINTLIRIRRQIEFVLVYDFNYNKIMTDLEDMTHKLIYKKLSNK